MIINRVGPVSCAKITGTLYAILGLIVGAFISLFALAGGMNMAADRPGGAMFGALMGIGAIVMLPILYGLCGFVATLIGAWLYNVAAGIVGGVEIDVR
jgi:hypothetical protein